MSFVFTAGHAHPNPLVSYPQHPALLKPELPLKHTAAQLSVRLHQVQLHTYSVFYSPVHFPQHQHSYNNYILMPTHFPSVNVSWLANLVEGFQWGSCLGNGTWALLSKDNVSQLTIAHKHTGLQRLNVDHHDAAPEFPVLKHAWEQTETLLSVCSGWLEGQQAVYMLTLQSSHYNHASWSLSEQQWCRPALRSFTVLRSTSKSFLKIELFVEGKSSEAQRSGTGWCFITLCFFNGLALENNFPAEQS